METLRRCGGLTREDRMTATIIKKRAASPLPARVAAIRGLLLSNNSLVTWLHRQTPRLLTGLVTLTGKERERERGKKKRTGERVRVLLGTIQFDLFNSSIHSQARTYSGSLAIYYHFLSVFNFSLCLSERSHLTARHTRFSQPPLTQHLRTPQRGPYRDTAS